MKQFFGSVVFLLSLSASATHGASYASAYEHADPYPSNIDVTSGIRPISNPSVGSSAVTIVGAMSQLQERDSIFTLLKRSFSEMNSHTVSIPISLSIFPRQAANDPTGSVGNSSMDVALWDREVNIACASPIANLSNIVTQITDPAGVAVCYNIPFYDSTNGRFASDIRLYKISKGIPEWETAGIRMSLSVEYEGAMVQLAQAPNSAANQQQSISAKSRRQNNQDQISTPRLLQTLRFVGQVNSDVMQNETMRLDPNIMKLLLTPTLSLVGTNSAGAPMNASVAAAQVNYVSGAFSNITLPQIVAAVEPFVLPGTAISIVPVGLYLFSIYMIFFLGIVGLGSWERYQFRISYRKRQSIRDGKTGVGKI